MLIEPQGKRTDMISIREILCATEIERPPHCGLRYSLFIAEQFQCSLHVLHACEGVCSQLPNRYVSSAERMEQALASHRLRERLDAVVRAVPTQGPGRAMSHIADGSWTESLLAFSERQRADVIVLDASSEGGTGSTWSGALVDQLAQRTACPLVTVPSTALDAPLRLKRLLLVVEPEATTGLLIDWAVSWASRCGAAVRLFYCEPPAAGSASGLTRPRWQHEVEDKLRVADVELTGSVAGSRMGIVESVLAEASLDASDLIMMSQNLRDDDERHVVGAVRRRSSAPVFSLRHSPPDRLFVDPALEREIVSSSFPVARAIASAR